VPPAPTARRHWSVGRVVAVVIGSLLAVTSLGLLAGGGGTLLVDRTMRDDDGYLTSSLVRVDSTGHAVVSQSVELRGAGAVVPERWLDRVKVEATARPAGAVFVGIAPTSDVDAYLRGVAHSVVVDPGEGGDHWKLDDVAGGTPATPPTAQSFWAESVTGPGTRTLIWDVDQGDWTIVVMDPTGAAPVGADVAVGATVPVLDEIGVALLVSGAVLGALALVVLVLVLRRPRTP
jgi:hypothetical protein